MTYREASCHIYDSMANYASRYSLHPLNLLRIMTRSRREWCNERVINYWPVRIGSEFDVVPPIDVPF